MMNPGHEGEAPGKNKEYTIYVNTRPKIVTAHRLSFSEVVKLAYPDDVPNPNVHYTVTYRKGEDKKPKGSMVDGDVVTVKEGMIFDVKRTDKS